MEKQLIEKPCLYLQKQPVHDGPAIDTIPAVKPQRAQVTCLADCDGDCPKTKNKRDISIICFRIMRHEPKKAGAAP